MQLNQVLLLTVMITPIQSKLNILLFYEFLAKQRRVSQSKSGKICKP